MVSTILLTPDFRTLATTQPTFEAHELLAQQGMYGASEEFAREHASPALLCILDAIPERYREDAWLKNMELNIDVRVHELLTGDYPATPGWHCDAPQRETEFSDTHKKTDVSHSLVANVSNVPNGVSNTVFCTKSVILQDDSMTIESWKELSDKLAHTNAIHRSKDGELVQFSAYTPHYAEAAINDGVRMFVRISQWVKPQGFVPGLTHCEQVYRLV